MRKILPPTNIAKENSGIKDLIILLKAEITAINSGNLDHVVDLYDQKTLLFETLKAASPGIEAQLKAKTADSKNLENNLTELLGLIKKDAKLLTNMTNATKEIIVEIARIRGRHNLDGLYGSEGEKHPEVVSFEQQIDQSV